MKLRPLIQQSTLYYENLFPSWKAPGRKCILHYQMLHSLGIFAFPARRALIPEAESNLWGPTCCVRFTWILLRLPFCFTCLHAFHEGMAWCPNESSALLSGQGAARRMRPGLLLGAGRTSRMAQASAAATTPSSCSSGCNPTRVLCTLGQNCLCFEAEILHLSQSPAQLVLQLLQSVSCG